jgi:parallel beta-helix repeat protein
MTGSGGSSVGTGGAAGAGGTGIEAGVPADETLCGDVQLTMAKDIPAGKITAVCAGATVTAAAGVTITVHGTLRVEGTAAMPVKFVGAVHPTNYIGYWTGIVVAQGGSTSMTYAQILDAKMPLDAKAGSSFTIDHLLIDNSDSMLHLAAGGTIGHGVFHARGTHQIGDPIVIDSASPKLSDTLVDKGYVGNDMIQVNGPTSAATFDHMEITQSHCAFHFNAGAGNTISNSNIHDNAYGMMVESSSGNKILHNNFIQPTAVNIGDCTTGASATVTDNFFSGAPFNASCSTKLTSTGSPAMAYTTGVGPQP